MQRYRQNARVQDIHTCQARLACMHPNDLHMPMPQSQNLPSEDITTSEGVYSYYIRQFLMSRTKINILLSEFYRRSLHDHYADARFPLHTHILCIYYYIYCDVVSMMLIMLIYQYRVNEESH